MLRSFVCSYRGSDGQLREYAVPAETIEQAMADAEATLDDPASIVSIYEDPDEFDFYNHLYQIHAEFKEKPMENVANYFNLLVKFMSKSKDRTPTAEYILP